MYYKESKQKYNKKVNHVGSFFRLFVFTRTVYGYLPSLYVRFLYLILKWLECNILLHVAGSLYSEPATFVQRLPYMFQTPCTFGTRWVVVARFVQRLPYVFQTPWTFGTRWAVVIQTSLVLWELAQELSFSAAAFKHDQTHHARNKGTKKHWVHVYPYTRLTELSFSIIWIYYLDSLGIYILHILWPTFLKKRPHFWFIIGLRVLISGSS